MEWLPRINLRVTDAALILFLLLLIISAYRAHRNPEYTQFNLFDLVIEGGRLSKLAVAFFVGLLALTWMMVRLTLDGKMTEGFFGLYATAIVGPVIAKLFSPAPLYATKPVKVKRETQPSRD